MKHPTPPSPAHPPVGFSVQEGEPALSGPYSFTILTTLRNLPTCDIHLKDGRTESQILKLI